MQMTGLHGTGSTKPELTQHHRQMACRTTPALAYLSLILCLSGSICAILLIKSSLYLNLSFSLTHGISLCLWSSLTVCLLLLLYPLSFFLSFCLPVIFFSLTNSVHVHNLQVVTVHLQQQTLAINEIPNIPKIYSFTFLPSEAM